MLIEEKHNTVGRNHSAKIMQSKIINLTMSKEVKMIRDVYAHGGELKMSPNKRLDSKYMTAQKHTANGDSYGLSKSRIGTSTDKTPDVTKYKWFEIMKNKE